MWFYKCNVHHVLLLYCRRAFDVSQQFSVLCRILNDQTQPMTVKVKQAWLEYVHELVPLMDSEDFQDSSGTTER